MPVEIGAMNQWVRVQRPVSVSDGAGGQQIVWQDVFRAPASVKPLQGRELYQARVVVSNISHNVVIRQRADYQVTAKMRLIWETGANAMLQILGVTRDEGQSRFWALDCGETF